MSTWHRHRAHRNSRASSIAAPGGEGWTIRNHRAILRSEPYASADLGAASDVTAKSIQSEAAPVSPAPAISPQRHSAVIAPAHGDSISGNIGSGAKYVPGGGHAAVLGDPSGQPACGTVRDSVPIGGGVASAHGLIHPLPTAPLVNEGHGPWTKRG